MTGARDRDLTARLIELEATVSGLTQELVSAEARIRQLERAFEGTDDSATTDPPDSATTETPRDPDRPTEATSGDEADGAGSDLDDIIVA